MLPAGWRCCTSRGHECLRPAVPGATKWALPGPGALRPAWRDRTQREGAPVTSVVIVPPPGLGSVYGDNRIWAQQYAAASPSDRAVVELAASTPAAVLTATRTAVAQAGTSGQVIYAVGHGGAASAPQAGQVDFAPNRAFRVSQFLVYDNDLTGTWASHHTVSDMESELRAADALRASRRRVARRTWCDRYITEHCDIAMQQVRELGTLRPHYQALCDLFHATPVARVILLTCNVANAPDFLDELATDLGVPARAYTVRVMSRWETHGRSRHVWMYLEGDELGHGTNNDRADVELLPGVSGAQTLTGRVRPAARRPGIGTHVPDVSDDD
jgi:hypothetical protein